MIRRLLIIGLFLLGGLASLEAQITRSLRAPVDSIPDFVKEKVTPEEYEMLKTISSVYIMDYTFVDEALPEHRERIDEMLKELSEVVKAGKWEGERGQRYAFSFPLRIDTTLNWEYETIHRITEDIQFCKRKAIVYTVNEHGNIRVQLEVWYVYDAAKREVNVIHYEFSPAKPTDSSKVKPFSRVNGVATFNYVPEEKALKGEFGMIFEYYLAGKYTGETVNKGFVIPLE